MQLMHSFKGFTAPEEVLALVRTGDISSFCLFAHQNVQSPAQLRAMNQTLWDAAREGGLPPPIIAIDQEGGQLIAIMHGATELPGNMALGATRSPELAEKAGYVLGRELMAMGVNMNFAPSVDVNNNPNNPVIGVRAFGDQAPLVAELGIALVRGMQAQGVIAVAKHFPGHGDTASDTHHAAPVITHTLERLNEIELYPFVETIKAKVGAILTAHVIFDALDSENSATVSRKVIHEFLREKLGYEGLIVSDAMDMYAVSRLGAHASVEAAIHAGLDLILLGHMKDQLEINAAFRNRQNAESFPRITAARENLKREMLDLSVVGSAEHQAIAQEIADRSITLVRDAANLLPLKPSEETQIGVITIKPKDLTPADTSSLVEIHLSERIRERHARVVAHEIPHHGHDKDVRDALEAVKDAQIVVVGTIQATHDPAQVSLIRALRERGQTPIVIALREPYDILSFPEVETYLCAYGIRPVTIEAVARVLFGEIPARGILPTTIPGVEQWQPAHE